jgi:hypothetical protein
MNQEKAIKLAWGDQTKFCTKCKKETFFKDMSKDKCKSSGVGSLCKTCACLKTQKYYQKNKDKKSNYNQQYYQDNINKENERSLNYYYNNRESISLQKKEFLKNNRKELNQQCREYKKNNPDKIKKYKRVYEKEKRETNQGYKIQQIIRANFLQQMKRSDIKKEKSFFKYTEIHFTEYLKHLENDPLWNNYNSKEYHIDHIIPCALYNFLNENDIKKCWHPYNLRILPAKENILKRDKLDIDLIRRYNITHLLPDNFISLHTDVQVINKDKEFLQKSREIE